MSNKPEEIDKSILPKWFYGLANDEQIAIWVQWDRADREIKRWETICRDYARVGWPNSQEPPAIIRRVRGPNNVDVEPPRDFADYVWLLDVERWAESDPRTQGKRGKRR